MLTNCFADWQPSLPENGWKLIESKLETKSNKRKMAWYMAASVVLGFGLFGISYKNNNFKVNKLKVNEVAVNNENEQVSDASFLQQKQLNTDPTQSMKRNIVVSKKATSLLNLDQPIKTNNLISDIKDVWSPENIQVDLYKEESLNPELINTRVATTGLDVLNLKNTLNYTNTSNLIIYKNKFNQNWLWYAGIGQMASKTQTNIEGDLKYIHKDYEKVQKDAQRLSATNFFQLGLAKKLSNSISLTAGVGLSQQESFYSYDFKQTPVATDNTKIADKFGNFPIVSYFDALTNQVKFNTISKALVIEVPIGVLINHTLNKNWSIITQAAIAPSLLTEKQGRSINYSDLEAVNINSNWYKKVVLNTQIGTGLYRNFGNHKLGIQLQAQYMPFGLYKTGASVNQKPLDLGLKLQWIGGFTKP